MEDSNNHTLTDNPIVGQLLSGKRPEGMSYDEFRIKRKALNAYLKRRKRGRFFYVATEVDYEMIDGKKKLVNKSYGPYRKYK